MAQLSGVVRVGSGGDVIEHGGKIYAKVSGEPQTGDIVLVTKHIRSYIQTDGFYAVGIDHEGDAFLTGEDEKEYYLVSDSVLRHVDVYRAELSTETLIATKREELAKITATIAELEAKLADEKTLKAGDYARVVDTGRSEKLAVGDIVVIYEIDPDDDELSLRVCPVLNPNHAAWVRTCGKITPAEAKAAILAQVETQFKEVA
ncbi:hypothetical protein [Paenibacillus terrae]|uniref:hypothetical protein n=1 Tax=Paenibacillus terrae TaxID=159743 RepID=UPI0011EA9016|nr:hypothetical protein [Paenibacillus terrae]